MAAHVVYLHGFASSPQSAKAALLREALAEQAISFRVPQLDGGDFSGMTMDGYRAAAADAIAAVDADGLPLLVIGSSLGGYTAALLAAEQRLPRASALLLIAPAFGFTDRWRDILGEAGMAEWRSLGSRPFYHHFAEQELPLGAAFLDSCEALPGVPPADLRPVTIIHGRRDETVDWQQSLRYAQQAAQIELHVVDDDHALGSARSEALLVWAARDLISRTAAPSAMPR